MGAKPTRCVEQPAFGSGDPASEMYHDALGAQSACCFRKARHIIHLDFKGRVAATHRQPRMNGTAHRDVE
jgi:hypothetical protein